MNETITRDEFLDPSALLRAVLDMFDAEIMFVDPDFKILYANKAKRENWKSIKENIVGTKCYELLEHYKARCPNCAVHRAMESGTIQRVSNHVSWSPLGTLHMNITAIPIRDEGGKLIGAIEVCHSVEDVHQANTQLETLNKEYEHVIYALSHDLRSPLISIEGFMNKLETKHLDVKNETVSHCMDRIHKNIHLMSDFIKVLLDTSRIVTGALEFLDVDMEELALQVIQQYKDKAQAQNAAIVTFGEFPRRVRCDRVRVLQVFNNLVNNALAHCEETPNLVIEIGHKDGVYWVRDNGPGIQQSFQDKVFAPFTQGKAGNGSSGDHFGMGLNIAHKIVQKHGGAAWIESAPGSGTSICFTLDPKKKR